MVIRLKHVLCEDIPDGVSAFVGPYVARLNADTMNALNRPKRPSVATDEDRSTGTVITDGDRSICHVQVAEADILLRLATTLRRRRRLQLPFSEGYLLAALPKGLREHHAYGIPTS